jgi:hypothetical protein
MEANMYKQIVLDQQKEKDEINTDVLVSRREEVLFDLHSPPAQIVTDIRRSRKSTLCHKVLKTKQCTLTANDIEKHREHMVVKPYFYLILITRQLQ